MAVLRLWVQFLARVKHGMVELSPPLEMLSPCEQVPLWDLLSPLELQHRDVSGKTTLWDGAWKVGEGQVVVVGRTGFECLHVESFWPFFGSPPFVGPQYGHRGKPVLGVGEHGRYWWRRLLHFFPRIGTSLWKYVERILPYQRGKLPVFAAGICRSIGCGLYLNPHTSHLFIGVPNFGGQRD